MHRSVDISFWMTFAMANEREIGGTEPIIVSTVTNFGIPHRCNEDPNVNSFASIRNRNIDIQPIMLFEFV